MTHSYPEALLNIARRVVWFKKPEVALKNKVYFLCYLMQYGITNDVITARQYFSDEEFKDALLHCNPGILDKRSWAYWNLIFFDDPNRPMPSRKL